MQSCRLATRFLDYKKLLNIVTILCFLIILEVGNAWAYHPSSEFKIRPTTVTSNINKITSFNRRVACYAGDRENNRGLNCLHTYQIKGLKSPIDNVENNGGHSHNFGTRPLIYPTGSSLIYEGLDIDPDPLTVKTYTEKRLGSDALPIIYQMPEVAGKVDVESIVKLPYNWVCLRHCYTDDSWRYAYTADIGSEEEFKKLPENPEIYIRCPYTSTSAGCNTDSASDDRSHPDMFRGKPEFVNRLIVFASYYQNSTALMGTEHVLRFTDMSLPRGGLFDIITGSTMPWTPPHVSHRTGEDADVSFNAVSTNGNFVMVDQQLINQAVSFSGQSRYDEGRGECTAEDPSLCIHIDYVE